MSTKWMKVRPAFFVLAAGTFTFLVLDLRKGGYTLTVKAYWSKLTGVFGDSPANLPESATPITDEMAIPEIDSGAVEHDPSAVLLKSEDFAEYARPGGTAPAFDSITYYTSILRGSWTMHFGESNEKNYYRFDNVDFTGEWYGGISASGEPYTHRDSLGYVSYWKVNKNYKGYYIELVLPNRGWKIYAYITGAGHLEFFNAFNVGH